MRIFLDIDDVIFDFQKGFINKFNKKNKQKSWCNSKLMSKRLDNLASCKEFWLNLPLKNKPNFIPKGFVSARSIPKTWTKESFEKINNIPGRSNVHQVPWGKSKVALLKELECGIFIDDKYETFKECNKMEFSVY